MFFKESTLYSVGDNGYHECRIPCLIATKDGTILAFNEAFTIQGDSRRQGLHDILLRRSFDGGKSFADVQVVAAREGFHCGNPSAVQDRDTGTIRLLYCVCEDSSVRGERLIKEGRASREVWITSSDDEGATWSEASEITKDVKLDNWSWYATGPGHGIQLAGGRLLIPCDHCEMEHGDPETDPDFSHVIYSDDHGASWHIGGITDRFANECTALESADGRVCINCRNQFFEKGHDPYFRRVGWSNDEGLTFSPLVRDASLSETVCEGSLCRLTVDEAPGTPDSVDGSVDTEGRLIGDRNRVLFTNPGTGEEGNRRQLTLRMSYDECRSWPVAKVICEGPSSYSDLCVLPDGIICCLYEKGAEGGVSFYSGEIIFARFDLEWLTDGEDSL